LGLENLEERLVMSRVVALHAPSVGPAHVLVMKDLAPAKAATGIAAQTPQVSTNLVIQMPGQMQAGQPQASQSEIIGPPLLGFPQLTLADLTRGTMQPTDMVQAQTIYTQVASEAVKQPSQRWQIIADTEARILEITQDVTVNKAQTPDRAFSAMDGYLI
jgi:hypothetical protein